MKKTLAIVGATLALTLTAACGSDDAESTSGGRASVEEIAKSLTAIDTDGEMTEAQIDCMAEALVGSDLSDEALLAVANDDGDYQATDEDDDALEGILDEFLGCAAAE